MVIIYIYIYIHAPSRRVHTTQRWLMNLARCGRIATIVRVIGGLDRNFLEHNLEGGFLYQLFVHLMKDGREVGFEKKLLQKESFNARRQANGKTFCNKTLFAA